jgi:hypothetical protein
MDVEEEALLFRLLACSLVRHLELRLDAADAVYFKLLTERSLVCAWPRRYGTAEGDVRLASAVAARVARWHAGVAPAG